MTDSALRDAIQQEQAVCHMGPWTWNSARPATRVRRSVSVGTVHERGGFWYSPSETRGYSIEITNENRDEFEPAELLTVVDVERMTRSRGG